MDIQKAYLVGTHRYSFRAGKPAEIVGVAYVVPGDGRNPRPAFRTRFPDGEEDYTAISDRTFYEIISGEDVQMGRIPEVIH